MLVKGLNECMDILSRQHVAQNDIEARACGK